MATRFIRHLLANLLVFTTAFAQWSQTNGPEGGEAKCLAVSEKTLFVGTGIGVFSSTDDGAHWSPTGLKNTIVVSLAVKSAGGSPVVLFAGTLMGGVHRSTDNGASWTQVNFGLRNRNVVALAVVDTTVFAGTDSDGVFLSPKNGDYWIPANEGMVNSSINSLAVIDASIYAGTHGGLLRSTNTGTSWTVVGLTSESVSAFAVLDTTFFAGTDTNGVLRSTDIGKTWTKVSDPDMGRSVRALAVANATLYAATDLGFYRTPNKGGYWIPSNTGVANISSLALLVNGTDLFAGTYGGVFRSTNGGMSWAQANIGLKTTVVASLVGVGGSVYAGTRNGFFRSTTGGNSWASPGANTWINAVAVQGPQIAAGSWGLIISSLNDGASWDWFSVLPQAGRVYSLAFFGAEVLAGTEADGVHRFKHNAPGWCTITSTGLTDTTVYSLAVSGRDVFAGTEGGVFHSADSGKNWTPASNGLTNLDVRAVAVNGSTLFAGTSGGDVFRSTNNGSSWIAANAGLERWGVLSFAVSGNNIFAGTWQGGVFLSTNNGTSWTTVNTGLMTSTVEPTSVIPALAVLGSDLYAGTYGAGVWKRPLSEMITAVDLLADPLPGKPALAQNYPNPFNATTIITYELSKSSQVTLTVYDMLGREVSVLVNEKRDAGSYEVPFDAPGLASGVYLYRLQAGDFVQTRKLLMVR